ncbi:putative sodium-coupled neutral amino acid transporter 10 isoform X2 [Venturia canescens]|uniref:putative sodium-coupled neutral amino acid transporter 10 isoform X2 n=1 Tax=Venturia canescens TaxID=32260 RepID=UPI001C9CDF89|nr:putative sodium-coupled neutral amino acid transporter 10 isoform X2 [Venturia canescens]
MIAHLSHVMTLANSIIGVICESTRHILLGDWYNSVIYWRPAGILQCLPIFSMALFCQTQLFEIYEAIPNVCLEKMNQVVRGALNICTAVYLCVGFFGYVAFCTQPFTGNILMSFEPSLTSDVIKMGFVFSVAFSFPLVIFPCRASLNSLLFRGAHGHDPAINYIPEVRFRWLTFAIVSMSLGTGILIPNIEFLLGIIGSTIGVMICLIFPAAFFISISTKNTNERLIAQAILFLGMWIMVLGTYANIYAMEDSSNARVLMTTGKPLIDQFNDFPLKEILKEDFSINDINILPKKEKDKMTEPKVKAPEISDVRHEPPIPVEREIVTEKLVMDSKISTGVPRSLENIDPKVSKNEANVVGQVDEKLNEPQKAIVISDSQEAVKKKEENEKALNSGILESKNDNLIDSDAIKKEETELEAAAGEIAFAAAVRHEKLRQVLEKHKLAQMEMMQEQKELLKDIKEQKQELEALELEKKRFVDKQNKIDKKIDAIEKKDGNIFEALQQKGQVSANQEKQALQNDKVVREAGENPLQKEKLVSGNERIVPVEKKNVSSEKRAVVDEKGVPKAENALPIKIITPEERQPLRLEKTVPKENKVLAEEQIASRETRISSISLKTLDEESHGPILNALTNWTLKKSGDENFELEVAQKHSIENSSENGDPHGAAPINLPIALRMSEKAKKLSSVDENSKVHSTNNSVDGNLPLRRDILQHADTEERGKREAGLEKEGNENKNGRELEKINESMETSNNRESEVQNDMDSERSGKIHTGTIENENSINLLTKEQCKIRLANKNSNIVDENVRTLKKRDLKKFHSPI